MHLNIHHIRNKLCNGEIKIELDNQDVSYHVLGFCETFLNEDINDNEMEIPGSLHRKDRQGKKGGGLAVYVAHQLVATRRQELEAEDLEELWIEIKSKSSRPFLLCNVYRPPDVCLKQWTHRFESVLEKVNVDRNEVIIMGDVNIDLSDNAKKKGQCNNVFPDVMDSFALEQLIMEPTRVTGTTSTLIDHVYVSNSYKLRQFYKKKKRLAEYKIQRQLVKKLVNKAKRDY